VLHAVGVLTVTAIGRPAAGLRIGGSPGLRAEGPKKCRRVKGSRAHFQIVGLMDHTATIRPKAMQGQDEVLEIHRMSTSSSRLLVKADEKQAEASKNDYRVSRNTASDFNGLHMRYYVKVRAVRFSGIATRRLNHEGPMVSGIILGRAFSDAQVNAP